MESDAEIRADVRTGVHKNSMVGAVWCAPNHNEECGEEYCAWCAAPYCSGDKKGTTKEENVL
jgi:hypothetical protein